MAKKIIQSADKSFMLKPDTGTKTGLELGKLAKEESKIIEEKFNEVLKAEVNKVCDEITNKIPGKKQVINQIFSKLQKLQATDEAQKRLSEIITSAIGEEEKKLFKKEELDEITGIISSMADVEIRSALNLDMPLRENPVFLKDINRARSLEYAKIIGLKADKSSLLADREIDIKNADEIILEELVKDNILTNKQKDDLLITSRLSRLTGENFELLALLTKEEIPSHHELVAMDRNDWLRIIKDNNISLPEGEDSSDSYAINLRDTIEKSFPTEYFLSRIIKKESASKIASLSKSLEPLLKNNVKLFSENISDLALLKKDAWKNISSDKQKAIKKDFETLCPLVNTYKHLGIGEVIDQNISTQEKQDEIIRRIQSLETFYINNPDLDIRLSNFTTDLSYVKDDGFNWQGINNNDKHSIKSQMAAYQRTYILGGNQEVAGNLLNSGNDSAYNIVSMPEETFIMSSGLGVEMGRSVYNNAVDLALGASHYFEAIRDAVKGNFKDLNVANQHPLVNDLKEIDGFDKLFGSQDYCDCEHCRSIFSPAAYFTDLMFFIQENVSKNVFTGSAVNHPLYLKNRRPDLWELTLSCYNTSTEIPYLEVVNEVLVRYLKTVLTVTNPYDFLRTTDRSINQPFNLPLEELRIYLSHFDVELYDLYKKMDVDIKDQHREKLKLSDEELELIATPNTAGVKKRFGNRSLNNFIVKDFIGYASITRVNLDDLLKTQFLPEITKVEVIKQEGDDIQQFTEVLKNLTEVRLDLIHRYLRLWKKTPWNLREFDLILVSFNSAGLLSKLEDTDSSGYKKILQLARAIILQDKLKLTVEELTTIIHQFPQKPLDENQKIFSERIFNMEKINDTNTIDKTPYLLAGIPITEAELLILAELLTIDLKKIPQIKDLSDLFRQARIAKALRMNIEDFRNALSLVNNGSYLKTLADIEKMTEFSEWLKKSPFNISELIFIIDVRESTTTM